MPRPFVVALVALATAGIALGGCLGERIETPPGEGGSLPPGHDDHHADPTSPGAVQQTVDVTLEAHAGMPENDLQFHPDPLAVQQGSVVEIRVENRGQSPHTFTIHAFGADTGVLAPGEEATLKFVADEAGTFEVMCDVPGHYQAGMKSEVVVQ